MTPMTKGPTETPVKVSLAQRAQFRTLLVGNPNYFGNLGDIGLKPVLNIAGDTFYEELGCVGYSLSLSRLEAVVSIKQDSGYLGGVCTAGSQEYVRFYLSFDGGTTWVDQGVAGFTAFDITGPKPLEYSVALPVSLPSEICFIENLPQVRAILSWNFIPPANTPNFVPVWGNVVNVTIQSPSFEFILLDKLLTLAKVQLPANVKQAVDLQQKVSAAPKKPLGAAELAALYKGKPVPAARFLYPEIAKIAANPMQTGGINLAAAKSGKKTALETIGVNIGDIVGTILATSGNTDYEELDCVGLDTNRSMLVGVVNVKLPYGFDGGLCTAGSTEYVAFWVDWGSGYQYAGTATINTHDISSLPEGGLYYAVAYPVDLWPYMKPCTNGAQTANVRAILSWQTPPPSSDPDYVPVWGNQANALVQIPSGQPLEPDTPIISIIGGIGTAQIDTAGASPHPGMTLPGAFFALQQTPADPIDNSRQCPFGGGIQIQGAPLSGYKYRVKVQDLTTGSPVPIVLGQPIEVTNEYGVGSTQSPDSNGFFNYLAPYQIGNQWHFPNFDNILAQWPSQGNDLYLLWLEIAKSSDLTDTVVGQTPAYLIQVQNTAPIAAININSGGDCKTFDAGGLPIEGTFVATEVGTGTNGQIGQYVLEVLPGTEGNVPSIGVPTAPGPSSGPSQGTTDTGPAPGFAWWISVYETPACGYVVVLNVWDNTIVDSAPLLNNMSSASVGFCVIATS